ncbi:MAG: hypothetical protein HGA45_32195 [Chloroflexales bacterium]|nr:hypothetical protein [Chloroflexales bacterium]
MATRASFQPDEWELLMRGYAQPAALVSLAEPGGALEETFFTFVALNEVRTQFAQIALIQDLLTPTMEEELARRAAEARRSQDGPMSLDEFRRIVLDDMRHAVALLRRKATREDVEAYRQLVLHVCTRVAGAYREGNLVGVGGLAAAPAEQAAIEAVQGALAPPHWYEQMVDRIKDLFRGEP